MSRTILGGATCLKNALRLQNTAFQTGLQWVQNVLPGGLIHRLVGFGVLGGQDSGLGSETMAQRVAGRTLFAGFGARAGGVLGVGAVDSGAPL